jgi:hypothetical protein
MKKTILYLFLAGILLASCSTVKYTNKIEGRSISQQCYFSTFNDSIAELYHFGYVTLTPVHDSIYEVCDSIYILQPSWSQVRAYDRQHHTSWEFWAGTGTLGSTIGSYAVLTSIGIGAAEFTLVPLIGIYIGGSLIGGSSEWYRANGEREIRKADYDFYIMFDDIQAKFWNSPAQAY